MRIGENDPVVGGPPPRAPVPGKSKAPSGRFFHDLFRINQVAQIGDKRNDENLLIAQIHLAFLKFHNALIATEKHSLKRGGLSNSITNGSFCTSISPAICDQAIPPR